MVFSKSACAYQLFIKKKKKLTEEKSKGMLLQYAYVSAHSYLYKKELRRFKILTEESYRETGFYFTLAS